MTDITRLLTSIKRRSAHVKEFGDDITFVKLEDLDVLVEALEKAQQQNKSDFEIKARLCKESNSLHDRLREAEKRIAELEPRTVAAESFTCPRCGRTTTHPEGWHYCHKREAD
ncbi:hypothetical protein ACXEI5_000297 [Klebsiella quasipneumoniae]